MDWFASIWKALEKLPFLAFAVFVVTGLLLAGGESTLRPFDMVEYRLWVSVGFLASTAIVGTQAVSAMGHWLLNRWRAWQDEQRIIARLHALSAFEKNYLRPYVDAKERSQRLQVDSGVVAALVRDRILEKASLNAVRDNSVWPFLMDERAFVYLIAHPELVAKPPELASDKQKTNE